MLVAIPSKGRCGQTTSDGVITSATMFVPEPEVESYQKVARCNVAGVPSDVRGITRTRNWILDNADDPHVVFIDDDVKAHGWIEMGWENAKHRRLPECEWLMCWRQLFEVTEGVGFRVWGVATHSARRGVCCNSPDAKRRPFSHLEQVPPHCQPFYLCQPPMLCVLRTHFDPAMRLHIIINEHDMPVVRIAQNPIARLGDSLYFVRNRHDRTTGHLAVRFCLRLGHEHCRGCNHPIRCRLPTPALTRNRN